MNKSYLAITLLAFLIQLSIQSGTFVCQYISGDTRITHTEMTEKQMNSCSKTFTSCSCEPMDTTCTFGPTKIGEFSTDIVKETVADVCPKNFCVCTSHDNYHAILAKRLGQDVQNGQTIEKEKISDGDGQEEEEGESSKSDDRENFEADTDN